MADIALIEKYGTEGITLDELSTLYSMIPSEQAYLLEYDARQVESTAIGVITPDTAARLGWDTERNSPLHDFVASILDDVDNESADGHYMFCGADVVIIR